MSGALLPLPQYAFMAWCLVKHRNKFTFYIYLDLKFSPNMKLILSVPCLTVSLCGMEGFAEFLNPLYIDWMLQLQTPAGCFADRVNGG
jgi:hypothetical protein